MACVIPFCWNLAYGEGGEDQDTLGFSLEEYDGATSTSAGWNA